MDERAGRVCVKADLYVPFFIVSMLWIGEILFFVTF